MVLRFHLFAAGLFSVCLPPLVPPRGPGTVLGRSGLRGLDSLALSSWPECVASRRWPRSVCAPSTRVTIRDAKTRFLPSGLDAYHVECCRCGISKITRCLTALRETEFTGQGDFVVDLVAVPDVTQIWLIGLRAGALLHLSKSVCLQYTRYFLACEALIFEQSFGEVLN